MLDYKVWLDTQECKIADLEPGERAWTPYMVRDLDGPCFPSTVPVTTITAYVERTETGFKRLWVRGFLKRLWIWYFECPWEERT